MLFRSKPEFDKRNVKAIALSVDPAESHRSWIADIEETQQTVVGFPIIADADKKVATLYDMIHPEQSATATVRSLFVIDPNKKIRLSITYPMSTGRNFDEVLRVIDALQLTDGYTVADILDEFVGAKAKRDLEGQVLQALKKLDPQLADPNSKRNPAI